LSVALALTLLSNALVFIEPQEVGVVISLASPQGYRDRPLRSGLRWIIPFLEQVYYYPIYFQTYTMSGKPTEGQNFGNDDIVARTSDGQEVSLDTSVIFRIDAAQVIQLHIDWQGRYIEDFIRPLMRGLIRTKVSQFTVDEVNSSRRLDLERDLSDEVQTALEDKGFVMDRFLLRNITFSPQYAATVEQKQVAQQQTIQKDYEAEQIRRLAAGEADRIRTIAEAEAEAVRVKAQAEAEALRVISEVLAERPDLITYRYVEKLGAGVKVMLVPNNAPYLLPLPSLETDLQPSPPLTPTVPTPTSPPSSEATLGVVLTPTLSLTPTPGP
jgi:regulator of protease activity HflC (stomatin/prohibitin superfamily)